MKKKALLFILFGIPIAIYILFATAMHNFNRLPVLVKEVPELSNFTTLDEEVAKLEDNITVLLVFGKSIDAMNGNAFNVNDKIYRENYIYTGFQVIVLAEDGTQNQALNLRKELNDFTGLNMTKWRFAFGSTQEIESFFDSLESGEELDKNYSTPYAFILDKERNLRGRTDDDIPMFAYETRSIAALNNTLVEDVKVLLAEYRAILRTSSKKITKYNEEK